MAVMDGVKVEPGARVWYGGWGRVVAAYDGFFVAEFGGSQYTVRNDGSSAQSRRPGRVVYWDKPLELMPESLKFNSQLREAHDLQLEHFRKLAKAYAKQGI